MSWPNVDAGLLAAGRCRPSRVRHCSVGSDGGRQRISAIIRPGASPSKSMLLSPRCQYTFTHKSSAGRHLGWPYLALHLDSFFLFFLFLDCVCIFVLFQKRGFLHIHRRYGSSRLAWSDESHTSQKFPPGLLTHLRQLILFTPPMTVDDFGFSDRTKSCDLSDSHFPQ